MTNEQLMQQLVDKGIISSGALSGGGKLNPQQADQFIDYVFDETGLKGKVRTIKFDPEQLVIDKIGVGKRVAAPAEEGSDPKIRRGVNTSKVVLQPVELIVPFEITDDFRQLNIEGDGVEDTIMKMFATAFANDVEDLQLNGDLLGQAALESDLYDGGDATRYIKDTYLAKLNGWMRLADDAHIYDAADADISPGIFSGMINAMPNKFKRNRNMLKFFSSTGLEQNYRQKVSTRATGAGDVALSTTQNLTPFGVELVPLSLLNFFPTIVEHVTLTGTDTINLRYKPIADEIVLPADLYKTPETPYVEGTDYTIDLVNGTITRIATGAIAAGATVKVTYSANPQLLLTEYRNLIIGIGRDVRVETDRDIFKRVDQFVMTVKVAVTWEETDAVVKGINIGPDVS